MELHSFIRSYLEIPVVLGLGLCRSKMMHHGYFKDQIRQDPRHEEVLSKIRYTLSSASETLDFYEAPILNYHLYLHQLDETQQLLTLVVHKNNVIQSFRAPQLIRKLKENLDEGKTLLKELSAHKSLSGKAINQKTKSSTSTMQGMNSEENLCLDDISIQDALTALNGLSRFAKQYIGPKIVANYWQISRPKHEWLKRFDIKYSASIRFNGDNSDFITPIQILILREWTQNFMNQCHTVVQDLPKQFESENIPDRSRKILSIYTSEYLKHQKEAKNYQSESLFGDIFSQSTRR